MKKGVVLRKIDEKWLWFIQLRVLLGEWPLKTGGGNVAVCQSPILSECTLGCFSHECLFFQGILIAHFRNHSKLYIHELRLELSSGGGTQLFSGRGVRPGFPKWGACELILASEKGGLWAEISKFGACELKISQFEGLWAENFQIWGLES